MYGVTLGSIENAINVSLIIQTQDQEHKEQALIDSGATENFLDYQTVKRLGIGSQKLDQPRSVINADGSPNGKGALTRYVELLIRHGKKEEPQQFYVADLGTDRVILGFPWLHTWNPKINWHTRTLLGGTVTARTMRTPEWAKIGLLTYQANRVVRAYNLDPEDAVYIQINKVNITQEWAITTAKDRPKMTVPEEYQDYADVFSEEGSKQLPPSRGEFDHSITFKEGAPSTICCKVYPMNCAETEFTRNWIQDNLAAGKIQESQSEITCPSFLIKKKNRMFRMVQDYRPINIWTVPDNTPLPLICTIVEDVEGMDLFSMFDIRSGYNNVLVQPEDRHRAAFKTTEGQFEPVVMPFGLMNAPATFQRMINHYARPLQIKYGTRRFKVYLDDVLVATGKNDPPEMHDQSIREWLEIC